MCNTVPHFPFECLLHVQLAEWVLLRIILLNRCHSVHNVVVLNFVESEQI